MKNFHLYNIPIAYMIVYSIAIIISGVGLFLLSQGYANENLVNTLSKIIETPFPKTLHGLIEVSTPHMFAMGTLIFVLTHFMLFSTKISQRFALKTSIILFSLALLNILAYLPILLGLVVSGWIKLISMGLFVLVFLFVLGMVTFSL